MKTTFYTHLKSQITGFMLCFMLLTLTFKQEAKAQPATANITCVYSGISESAASAYIMPTGGGNFGRGAVSGTYYYHFYKFNTSTIPSGSKILSVNLSLVSVQRVTGGSFTGYDVNGQFNVTYRRLNTDPATETASNLFSQIRTTTPIYGGTRLHSNAGTAGAPVRYTRPLSNQAVADLQAAVDASQTWFAVGLDHDNTTTGRWFRFTGHNYTDAAQRPYLVVTYITPSGETITDLPTDYSADVNSSTLANTACRAGSSNTQFQGRITTPHYYSCYRFDISSLSGATIKYANFSYYVSGIPINGPCQFYSYVRKLDVDPVAATGATLLSKIHNAPLPSYNIADVSTTFFPSSNTGRYEFTLNAAGIADLQAAINANQSWFALSFDHTFVGSMAQHLSIKGSCESNAALQTKLAIGYTPGIVAPSTWVGGTVGNLTNWHTATNWDPIGVPNSCTANVLIPNTTYHPVVSSTVSVKNIELQDSASLTLNADMNVCGDFTGGAVYPSYVLGTASSIFNGIDTQFISGIMSFNALQINNNSIPGDGDILLTSGSNISINNGLHLQAGNFNASNGTLRLLSTAANHAAYIDDFTSGFTGSITGNILADRFIPTAGRNQHFISSPVNNAALSHIGASGPNDAYITPTADCNKQVSQTGSAYGSVFAYDDVRTPASTCAMANWKVQSSGSMANAKGYSAYLSGNSIITLSGTPNTGNKNITVGNSGNTYVNIAPLNEPIESGWNLVGNPYPSTIVLSTLNDHSGFDNQVQVWQTSGPFSGSWQTLNMNGATIAPFQGFMVHRNSGGNAPFYFYQNERTRATNTNFYRTESENSLMLEVDFNGGKDLTRIEFNTHATNSFDSEYDANKPGGNVDRPTLYTHLNNNMWYSINTLHSIEEAAAVPMGLAGLFSGSMSIAAKGLSTFDPTTYIFLEDKKTGKWHNLREGAYAFTRTNADNQDRFMIHFTPAVQVHTTEASCSGNGMIQIEQAGSAIWTYTLSDNNSTVISSGRINASAPAAIVANAGVYTLTLSDHNGYTVMKNIQVNGEQAIVAAFSATSQLAKVQEDITFISQNRDAVTFEWNFGDGATANTSDATHRYVYEGVYTVSLTVINTTGCKSVTTQTVTITSREATGLGNITYRKLNIWSSGNQVFIDFGGLAKVEAEIELYNVIGQLLSSEKFGRSTIYSKEIPNMEAAYVIVKVKSDDITTTKRVFIVNTK